MRMFGLCDKFVDDSRMVCWKVSECFGVDVPLPTETAYSSAHGSQDNTWLLVMMSFSFVPDAEKSESMMNPKKIMLNLQRII